MCDTIVSLGNSTADGSVIFGKNSDREPNEAHEVVIIPAGRHENTTTLLSTGGMKSSIAPIYAIPRHGSV